MSRIIVFICIIFTSLVSISNIIGCRKAEYKDVPLDLYSLILPGATDAQHEVIAKFTWQGGGWLQELSEVRVDLTGSAITIQPIGRLGLGNICTHDIFERIATVSLGILAEGSYAIVLVGHNYTYYDTLYVPIAAPESLFQFQVTVIEVETYQPVPGIPVELRLDDTAFTQLCDTTDMTGKVFITYTYDPADTLRYSMFVEDPGWPGYFGQTEATKGIPEVITAGIADEFQP